MKTVMRALMSLVILAGIGTAGCILLAEMSLYGECASPTDWNIVYNQQITYGIYFLFGTGALAGAAWTFLTRRLAWFHWLLFAFAFSPFILLLVMWLLSH
jgi:hypothetical protein